MQMDKPHHSLKKEKNKLILQKNVHVNACVLFQECVCVYLPEGYSRLLSDDPPHELPQEGKIRCVIFVCVCVRVRVCVFARLCSLVQQQQTVDVSHIKQGRDETEATVFLCVKAGVT